MLFQEQKDREPRQGATAPDATASPRTLAIIDLDNLRHNLRILRQAARGAEIMAVVKADAYGHGAIPIARTLAADGVSHFAVATLHEALELRSAGINQYILVFNPPFQDELPLYFNHRLDVSVTSSAVADQILRAAREGMTLRVHVKVDTGMHRLGVALHEAASCINALVRTAGVQVAGVWTHFATAQNRPDAFVREQLERFNALLPSLDGRPGCIHTANSAALLSVPGSMAFDAPVMARPGIALYGLLENPDDIPQFGLKPVMTLRSHIQHLQVVEAGESVSYGRTWTAAEATRVATIGAGYADGFRRALSNRGRVGVAGGRAPIVGNVCMDMFMISLGGTEVGQAGESIGDPVVLFGEEGPSAAEVAQWMGSIPHEVCSGISQRVPRLYVRSEEDAGGASDASEPDFL